MPPSAPSNPTLTPRSRCDQGLAWGLTSLALLAACTPPAPTASGVAAPGGPASPGLATEGPTEPTLAGLAPLPRLSPRAGRGTVPAVGPRGPLGRGETPDGGAKEAALRDDGPPGASVVGLQAEDAPLGDAPGLPCSLGPTHGGRLVGGRAMPDVAEALALLPQTVRRGARHGHPRLVAALLRAARRVAALHPGSRLHVGDLSLARGGNFGPHRSHTSGRDVDLAFYLMDATGAPADRPVMAGIGPDGRSALEGLAFDAARNWRLVSLLLGDPDVEVQWIFVARHLRERLLAEARVDDPTLAARAARVLLEPRDSSPHADHFHIRVYCDRTDRLGGCVDAPPFHPWVDDHRDALSEWLTSVEPFLAHPGTDEYRYALTRIAEGSVRLALPRLLALPQPTEPADAQLLSDTVAHLRGEATRPEWRHLQATDSPP
jgi:penicillin-insensitive murein endopeptidase